MRTLVPLLLIACATSVAQDLGQIKEWQFFLQDVAAVNRSVAADPPVKPPLQKALGLTDSELDVLKTAAADYETKNSLFLAAVRPLKMESLLQSLDSGKVSESLAQRVAELENEHTKIVSEQIERLRSALGGPRFEVLETFVRAKIPK